MTDPDALYASAVDAENEARRLKEEARRDYREAAWAGSFDAWMAQIRLAVADGEYGVASVCFFEVARRHPEVEPARLVTVAPDVLGPVPLDGDEDTDYPGAGVFTIIGPDGRGAAAVLHRISRDLMRVDEHGHVQSDDPDREIDGDPPYTPNFVFDVEWFQHGAMVSLDTKGWMSAAMGRTMVGMIVTAMLADGVVGHIAGARLDLNGEWMNWPEWVARETS